MRGKETALKEARHALLQLGIPDCLPELAAAGVSLQRSTKIFGSHSTVTYPPLSVLRPLRSSVRRTIPMDFGTAINLYIHIPLCEMMCTFCEYSVNTHQVNEKSPTRIARSRRYQEALIREMKERSTTLKRFGTTIESLFIGGGTPTVLPTGELVGIINRALGMSSVSSNVQVCVEGSPKTITAPDGLEKLEALKAAGVNRFSFGVQSFLDSVTVPAGRGKQRSAAIRACELVARVFPNWNIDLIQSLYKGNLDEIWANLECINDLRPPHVTWYHGRFADSKQQAVWRRDASAQAHFEDDYATLLGRMLIWQELKDMGYHQLEGNRFVLDERFIDPFKKSRTSVSSDVLGLGASAYSHIDWRGRPSELSGMKGIFFRNHFGIDDYMNAMERGEIPIGSFYGLDRTEYLAALYVIGLRNGVTEAEFDTAYGELSSRVANPYLALEERLKDLGLIDEYGELGHRAWRLTPLGQLFEDETVAQFYSPDVKGILG